MFIKESGKLNLTQFRKILFKRDKKRSHKLKIKQNETYEFRMVACQIGSNMELEIFKFYFHLIYAFCRCLMWGSTQSRYEQIERTH